MPDDQQHYSFTLQDNGVVVVTIEEQMKADPLTPGSYRFPNRRDIFNQSLILKSPLLMQAWGDVTRASGVTEELTRWH